MSTRSAILNSNQSIQHNCPGDCLGSAKFVGNRTAAERATRFICFNLEATRRSRQMNTNLYDNFLKNAAQCAITKIRYRMSLSIREQKVSAQLYDSPNSIDSFPDSSEDERSRAVHRVATPDIRGLGRQRELPSPEAEAQSESVAAE